MNPNTGEFHELMMKETSKRLAEDEERREKVRAKRKGKSILHPDHEDLIFKASRKPVPASWPIFTIGERYEITIDGLVGTYELMEIRGRDMILGIVGKSFPLHASGQVFEIKDHKFRLRKRNRREFWIRPVVGNPHNYLEK